MTEQDTRMAAIGTEIESIERNGKLREERRVNHKHLQPLRTLKAYVKAQLHFSLENCSKMSVAQDLFCKGKAWQAGSLSNLAGRPCTVHMPIWRKVALRKTTACKGHVEST